MRRRIYLLALAVVGAAVGVALLEDILDYAGVEAAAEIEIEEASARDLAPLKEGVAKLHSVDESLSYLAGGAVQIPRPSHGGVCGIIAEIPVGGHFHVEVAQGHGGEFTVRDRPARSVHDGSTQLGDRLFN